MASVELQPHEDLPPAVVLQGQNSLEVLPAFLDLGEYHEALIRPSRH
jgi:hypothetical protein